MSLAALAKKKVSQLTPAQKALLREYLIRTRGKRAALLDMKKASKRIPKKVKTWLKHPERYDIPGVDTPDVNMPKNVKAIEKYHKAHRKTIAKLLLASKMRAAKPGEVEAYRRLLLALEKGEVPPEYILGALA